MACESPGVVSEISGGPGPGVKVFGRSSGGRPRLRATPRAIRAPALAFSGRDFRPAPGAGSLRPAGAGPLRPSRADAPSPDSDPLPGQAIATRVGPALRAANAGAGYLF